VTRITRLATAALGFGFVLGLAATDVRAQAMESPWGAKAGYYPGQAYGVRASASGQWRQWVANNKEAIETIDAKWSAIKTGAASPGCFGRALFDCIASLGQTLVLADWYLSSDLFYTPPLDVNGKPLRLKWINLTAYVPEVKQVSEISDDLQLRLEFSDRNEIAKIGVRFDITARTQESYDRTGAYEIFSMVAKERCPQLSRNEFARFIENKLKPAMRSVKAPREPGYYDIKSQITPFLSFCGRELQLKATEARSLAIKTQMNPTGSFGGTRLFIR